MWFRANFEQQESCARCFGQGLSFIKSHQFKLTGQLHTRFLTGFSFLTIQAIWRKNTVAQCDLRPISSNSTVPQAAFYKFYLIRQIKVSWILLSIDTTLGRFSVARPLSHKLQVKQREYFVRLFNKRRQFRLTGPMRTEFLTGFCFLTIRFNLKQNDSCAVWLGANFEQQHGCARHFWQVLAF